MKTALIYLILILCCCCLGQKAEDRASHGPGREQRRAEEMVCCAPETEEGAGRAGRCCGKGWGLHCCQGELCCLDDKLALRSGYWDFKHWSQWLNLTVVLLVIVLMCILLLHCYRRSRLMSRRRHRLVAGADLFSYGTRGHDPSAPQWNQPVLSQWVDFSFKPPPMGTPLKPASGPYYQQPSRVRPLSSSDSECHVCPSPTFSSSEEEYKLLARLKEKQKIKDAKCYDG